MRRYGSWDIDSVNRPKGEFFVCVEHKRVMPPAVAMRHLKHNNQDCKLEVFLLAAWKWEIAEADVQ